MNLHHHYIVNNEEGKQIAEYYSNETPPFKGDVIQLKGISGYEQVEILSSIWQSTREDSTVTLKVKPVIPE